MTTILDHLTQHQEQMLKDLRGFVERETPSTEKPLLDDFAEFLASYAEDEVGGRAEIIPARERGNHVRVEWGDPTRQRPILLLGHYDTVWPTGTLDRMPFTVAEDVARGPGVFDMKCGLVQGLWAVRAFRQVADGDRALVFFCNADEELGSGSSRALIEEHARAASTVLVLEPSMDGALKTARKGAGRFEIHVTGRPAHAGLDPFGGVSAIEELARLTLELHDHSNRETGTTVNVGVSRGGTRFNVIAAEATAEVDLRVVTWEEMERMTGVIHSLQARNPEAQVRVEGGMIWPPMERTEKTAALFSLASRLAHELGFELREGLAGGASDGSFCAAQGTPVLDGLGAVGGGAHAVDEHVRVADMPQRSALVARLLEVLE